MRRIGYAKKELKIKNIKIKNGNGEYFVEWIGQIPVFNSNCMFGKRFSENEAKDLIQLLAEENMGVCESVLVEGE